MKTKLDSTSNTTAAVGMVFHLADGSIQGCNVDAERILGYTAEQLVGASSFEPPWQTIHEDGSSFSPETHPAIATLRTGEPLYDVVMGFYKPNGELVWLSIDSQPLFQANKTTPYGVVVTFRDITEQSRPKLWQPNRYFIEEIADAIPGVLSLFDAIARRNLYVNSQTYNLLGYTAEEVLDLGAEFVNQAMHPEDRQRLPAHLKQLDRSISGEVFEFEYRMLHKNGEWRWFSTQDRVFSHTADGSVHLILSIARDISDRKQTEAELVKINNILQSIISGTTDVIFVKDLQGRYVIANQAAADWLGTTVAEMLGRDDTALFSPEIARSIIAIDRQIITQKRFLSYEEEIPHQETVRSLLTNKYPWRDEEGNILGVIGICRDVTVLKQSQQQLDRNEQLLRLALSCAKAGSWDWEIATGKLMWSSESYDLYGVSSQSRELQYEDWRSSLHPDDLEKCEREIEKIILGQSSEFRTEFRIIHPQKGIRWLLGIGNVTRNENGEPIRLSGINLDITESKQTEEQLRRSERQLRRVLDSLFSFVGVMTPDGILIEANRTALEAANLQPEDVLGKPYSETYWWSYSPEIQAQLNDAIQRAVQGENISYDVTLRLGAEKFILIDFSLVPLFDNYGRVEYLIPSGIDISDREASKQALQQREYELRLITEAIPQQIWTALPNGKIDYINQRWQEYTGISQEQVKQSGWEIIVHPDDLRKVREIWIEAVRSKKKYDMEARLRGADGTYRWFLARARPLRNERGEIIKWYGTNTDITLIKELEDKLRQQTEDLIRANQLKDEFLAIVSHELRTPLNPILGWSQLLINGSLNPEQTAKGLKTIQRSAKLQSQLIEDLLDVSRILRGKLNLNITSLDLESAIRAALATVHLSAQAKSIEIETLFEPNIGRVLGDPSRLQQIVWNLLSNGIKFTPENGKVTVKLERVGTQAQIQVKDTGEGIDPEFLPHVFDRFRQAESSSTRKFGGLGLGLSIVYHLTELHGGTVFAHSPGKGQGATFTVKLPLNNSPATATNNLCCHREQESHPGDRFLDIRVLVVDDEADSRDLLTFVLERESAIVTAVASANEALAALKESTFDAIVSDIGMPQTDGYTLMKQIRSLPEGKTIPAIALTAYAGEIDRQRSLEAGFQAHISKPINIPDLINVIAQLV